MSSNFKLYDYQEHIIAELNEVYRHRTCVSLSTGGGKTILFAEIINTTNKRVLVLVHRDELIDQTIEHLKRDYDLITPKSEYTGKDVVIAMVQTLKNRLNKIDINSFDILIIDECHRGEFLSLLDIFKGQIIGFTATPNYEKTEYFYKCKRCGTEYLKAERCCKVQLDKYKRTVPLSRYYHHLIEGAGISDLIERGYLIPDEHHVYQTDETIEVYDHKTGELTEESANAIYGSPDGLKTSVNVFNRLCRGKKTIIFNPNTLVNRMLYESMIADGINCKMYDSKNSEENRKEIVNWFENTPDAVLLNVHVFTTGFNCTDVECIFLNKKTRSINLYIQMVGRGGRRTDKIFKPKFTVVDIGNNLELFGKWSDERDWNEYFYKETVSPVGSPKPMQTRECHNCEAILAVNSLTCTYCGVERVYSGRTQGRLTLTGKKVMPQPEAIIKYCESTGLDCNYARKLTVKYVVELFENTSLETFHKNLHSGRLFQATKKHLQPYYFAISKSKLEGNRNRKLDTFAEQTIKELKQYYDDRSAITTEDFSVLS